MRSLLRLRSAIVVASRSMPREHAGGAHVEFAEAIGPRTHHARQRGATGAFISSDFRGRRRSAVSPRLSAWRCPETPEKIVSDRQWVVVLNNHHRIAGRFPYFPTETRSKRAQKPAFLLTVTDDH